jgi:hypothetical protein
VIPQKQPILGWEEGIRVPPYRNPVEARRKKERPVQKVADENCYMSSADFNDKHTLHQRRSRKEPLARASDDPDGGDA